MASNTESSSLKCTINSYSNTGNVIDMCVNGDFKDKFHVQLNNFYKSQCGTIKKPWTSERVLEVIMQIKTAKVAMDSGVRRNSKQYYWCKKYEVMNIAGEDYLILKKHNPEDHNIRVVPVEQYFDTLLDIHEESGHGGRDKMLYALKNRLYIQRKAVEIFVSLCPTCQSKRNLPTKSIVTKPIIDFNCRGQVALIDLQSAPDGDYKWLLNYQDHTTKLLQLRPLRSKQASEVAQQLIDIFLTFGVPYVLQSDNGREFTAKIIEEVVKMWPECKVVHGSPSHPQAQGTVERSNRDVENMLRIWMRNNNSTNWSFGCKFVQYQKNLFNQSKQSPYSALFGCNPKSSLQSTNIPGSLLRYIHDEEDLENIVNVETNNATVNQGINNISEDTMRNICDKNPTVLTPQSSTMESSETLQNTIERIIFKNDEKTCIPIQFKNTDVVDAIEVTNIENNNMDISEN